MKFRRQTPPLPTAVPTAIASPCVSVCRVEPASGYCEGCLRTLDEIAAWGTLSEERKLALLAQLRERRRQATLAPGAPGNPPPP